MRKKTLATILWSMGAGTSGEAFATEAVEFFVDRKTKQIFAEPGPGRERLGKFVQVDENDGSAKLPAPVNATAQAIPAVSPEPAPTATAPAASTKPATASAKKWYDRLSLRGYTQLRYNHGIGQDASSLRSPGDRFIGDDQTLGLRRARVVLSGDIADNVSIYLQPDFASTPTGSSTSNFAQLRDAYADIYFDAKREYRVRAGQSKVPYGWENLQSSQNRLSFDRADALNAGIRDERDIGVFFYYTPSEIQARFQYLVKAGLKGSGDYGVLGLGIYNGQGANRAERNGEMHTVLHLTYPFKFANGQYLEVGADAYTGRFKVATPTAIAVGKQSITPVDTSPANGAKDQRVAVHAIYYPQPFGLQAEWTVGKGPQLELDKGTIRTRSLRGGYVQAMYKIDSARSGTWLPYLKWQTYRGAAKFDTNNPRMVVDETELGVEWQPASAIEITMAYANMRRTHVGAAPYAMLKGDLLRLQLQVNY
ncbi:porin [Dyella sp. 20L07]|uniref:porin n=1 Tax=Dyella sp. 20L07 TaxID=3384240 RepID=UPI003D2D95A8